MATASHIPLLLAAAILLAVLIFAWRWPLPEAIRRHGWRDLRWWALLLISAQLAIYWLFG